MEFQAVVMAAGKGSRLTDLTSGCPKCLLPVGNQPMILYPLRILEQAGFHECMVIVLESVKSKVIEAVSNKISLKLDVIGIPQSEDRDIGTADSFRFIRDKIRKDVIVISCDLLTKFSLHHLTDLHRMHNSSLTVLLSSSAKTFLDAPIPGPKTKQKPQRDIIGIADDTNRLVFLSSEADFEDTLSMKMSLFKQFPLIEMHTRLQDAHLYVMKKWLIDYVIDNETISTIKGELIPILMRKQIKKPSKENDVIEPSGVASVVSLNTKKDIYLYAQEGDLAKKMAELVGFNSKSNETNQIKCFAFLTDDFCLRTNTLQSYFEANKQIYKHFDNTSNSDLPANVSKRSQVGNDCLVGGGTTVSDKVSVKHSVIGNNCVIKERAKIANSLIMDNVTIEEGSSVHGCIICSNAFIDKSCELKDCIVANGQSVMALSKLTNEVIMEVDSLMEI